VSSEWVLTSAWIQWGITINTLPPDCGVRTVAFWYVHTDGSNGFILKESEEERRILLLALRIKD
jgi:hypothetical protein